MGYIIDIIILAIIGFCIFRGVRAGAVRTAFSLLSVALALILTFMFASPFSQYIEHLPFGQSMHDSVENTILQSIEKTLTAENTLTTNTTESIIQSLSIPNSMKKELLLKSDFVVRNAAVSAANAVADALASAYLKIIFALILFLLILLIFRLVRKLTEQIFKLPLLKELNHIVGAVAGLVNGILLAYLLFATIGTLSTAPFMGWLASAKETSFLFKNIYENNFLLSAIL